MEWLENEKRNEGNSAASANGASLFLGVAAPENNRKKNTKIAPPPPHPPHRNRPKKNNENKDEMNEQMFYRVLPSFSSLSGMKVTPRVLTGAANELICIMKLLDQLLMGLFPLAAHLHNERLRGVETVFIGGSFAYAMMAPFIECRPAFYRMLCK